MNILRSVIHSHLSDGALLAALVGLLLGAISIYFFIKERYAIGTVFLFLAALVLRLMMAQIDPFLHLWDEQYHALVAKNMMSDPFVPKLYTDPVMPYDYKEWSGNHIWLHKQPLFLWLMALSMKIFGTTEFALRIPSALMLSLLVPLIYRMGSLLADKRSGFIAAFLCAFAHYQLQMSTGYINTDHNDIAFVFFVACSMWAFFEFRNSRKKRWICLVGVFCGCAMLVKWLPGLLVFAGWLAIPVFDKGTRSDLRSFIKQAGIALGIAFLVFLPWQVYTYFRFPKEMVHVFLHNSRHFSEALDGHAESTWFHFSLLHEQYWYFAYLLPVALYFSWRRIKDKGNRIVFFTCLFFVYAFFTVAATKMPLFCMIVSPLIFLASGMMISGLLDYFPGPVRLRELLLFFGFTALAYTLIGFKAIENDHTDRNKFNYAYRHVRTDMADLFRNLDIPPGPGKTVVFNCGTLFVPMAMFYSTYMCYSDIPDEEQKLSLEERGIKLVVLDDGKLPRHITSDSSIVKIPLIK